MPVTEMTPDRRVGLVVAGLAGAWLTAHPVISHRPVASFDGVWLGAAMAAYLALAGGYRSILRALCLVAMSATAFWIAQTTGAGLELAMIGAFRMGDVAHAPHGVPVFFAGAIGGVVLAGATFLLYIDQRGKIGPAILSSAITGGVLAVIGNAIGKLQNQVAPDEISTALSFVWQPGMALAIGFLWPVDADVEAGAVTVADRATTAPNLPTLAIVLMLAALAPPVVGLVGGVRAGARADHSRAMMNAYRAEHPPMEGMPAVPERPPERIAVQRIANYHSRILDPRKTPANITDEIVMPRPQAVEYLACYSDGPTDTCSTLQVRMTEYPTPEWSAYALRGLPTAGVDGADLGAGTITRAFGQPILDRGLPAPTYEYYWRSGVFVVHVAGWKADPGPVVRAYLERYPSSL